MLTEKERLQRRALVELVEDDETWRVTLELEHQTGNTLGRLVADGADALDLAPVDQLGRLLLDLLDTGLVRDLGDHDLGGLALFDDLGFGADLDRSTARCVGLVDDRHDPRSDRRLESRGP